MRDDEGIGFPFSGLRFAKCPCVGGVRGAPAGRTDEQIAHCAALVSPLAPCHALARFPLYRWLRDERDFMAAGEKRSI